LPENLFEQSHYNVEFKQAKSLTKLPFESSTFNFVTMVSAMAIVLIKISERSLVFSRYLNHGSAKKVTCSLSPL